MSTALPRLAVLLYSAVLVVVRAPHVWRSRGVRVARHRRDLLGTTALVVAWLGPVLPLVWALTPVLGFADRPLRPGPFWAGLPLLALGLALLHRAHRDLGTNWSVVPKVREAHRVVTEGAYRSIRHPIYAALILYYLGQALVVPNWAVAGHAAAFLILVVVRIGPEERLLAQEFGGEYQAYRARSKRLIPGVF